MSIQDISTNYPNTRNEFVEYKELESQPLPAWTLKEEEKRPFDVSPLFQSESRVKADTIKMYFDMMDEVYKREVEPPSLWETVKNLAYSVYIHTAMRFTNPKLYETYLKLDSTVNYLRDLKAEEDAQKE